MTAGLPVGPAVPGWTERPWPAPVVLTGRYCRLEPLAAVHAAGLFAAYGRDRALWTYLPAGPFADLATFRPWLAGLAADPAGVLVAILVDGEPVGIAGYLRVVPGAGSLEIGYVAFSPRLQRTRAATEAMFLLARRVFEELGYRRYEWKCDALNAASQSAAARLGFSFEGVWRQALVYKGRNRDTAWYAMTDGDWALLAPAYRRWLEPANFDPAGHQRSRLGAAAALAARPADSAGTGASAGSLRRSPSPATTA